MIVLSLGWLRVCSTSIKSHGSLMLVHNHFGRCKELSFALFTHLDHRTPDTQDQFRLELYVRIRSIHCRVR
jgi:hypothetical protein